MPFKRKPGLGHYNAPRADWYEAYRAARVAIGRGEKPDHRLDGVRWKAQLIVAYDRDGQGDQLSDPAPTRLALRRLNDEVISLVLEGGLRR
ncbi:hypothetical protein CAZ10_10595 [Pseudomonas aeruginosa]|uniref:Uncharacterized protein n=1 Tax=Pseudomonas aeruginosa TaxID=287 RepID=A0A241XS03_PSEAI|nr:hypothetical protein [Pseudomonas sp. AU12215]OBY57605.1 hypothetical protein A9513_002990 [Pseudomonas sp. AU12215]OTI63269.1 hypothetical protein CAZ10_10595 [Pseudomonas aeruginosa]